MPARLPARSRGPTRTSSSHPAAPHRRTANHSCTVRSSTSSRRSRRPRARAPTSVSRPSLRRRVTRPPTLPLTAPAPTDSFLNVTKSATEKDISKSYRKRSLELQCVPRPDAFPSSPFHLQHADIDRCAAAPTRTQMIRSSRTDLLGLAQSRASCATRRRGSGPSSSAGKTPGEALISVGCRYDHFYENGVPRWRGTLRSSAPVCASRGADACSSHRNRLYVLNRPAAEGADL